MTARRALVAAAGVLLAGAACGRGGVVDGGTIEITIRHSRFEPDVLRVAPGSTVRLVVRNTDPIDHEFILGDRRVQRAHELGTEPTHAPRPGEVTVPAGETVATTYTFGGPGALLFGCHLPGHYAFGMRGTVAIG